MLLCHFKLPLSKFSLSNHVSLETPVSLTCDQAFFLFFRGAKKENKESKFHLLSSISISIYSKSHSNATSGRAFCDTKTVIHQGGHQAEVYMSWFNFTLGTVWYFPYWNKGKYQIVQTLLLNHNT